MENIGAGRLRQWVILLVLCVGGTTIYSLPLIRGAYYIPLQEALGLTHSQVAYAASAYGITAMISHLPGGWLADRFSTRSLLTISFLFTGAAGLYFSTFPSYKMYLFLMTFWGVTTTLTYWAALIKATRELKLGGQGAAFGMLEGGRGLTGAILSTLVLSIFAMLGSGKMGFRWVIIIYSVLCLGTAPLTWFIFNGESPKADPGMSAAEGFKKVIKMPAVWLIALVVMFSYASSAVVGYIIPFTSEVMGAAVLIGVVLGTVKMWVRPLAATGTGFLADKVGVSKTISWLFFMLAAGMVLFVIIPGKASLIWLIFLFSVIVSLVTCGLRVLYYAVFEEGGIPLELMGTVVGFVSLIGYTPDVYMYFIAGHLLDNYSGGLGYRYLFALPSGFALCGLVATLIFRSVTKKEHIAAKNTSIPLRTDC